MEPKFLCPVSPSYYTPTPSPSLPPRPLPPPPLPCRKPGPAGADTHRLVEAHVEELLVPLLDLRPGPVPQLPALALQAAQEALSFALVHSHVGFLWSRR